MRTWQAGLAGAVVTALLLASLFPPLHFTFLAPFALVPLLYALSHLGLARDRFFTGWLSGTVYWLIVCYWIGDTLALYGGLNGPLALLALLLFALAKGLHLAVFAWLSGPLLKRAWAIPAIAALWTGIERTHGPLGFAWLTLGNAGIDMSLPLRIAPVLGVYGLSFIFAALSVGIVLVIQKRDRRELAWLLALAGLWFLPAIQLTKAPDAQAVSLQPAFSEEIEWSFDTKSKLVSSAALFTVSEALDVSKPKPSLVLWPEAPAPFYFYEDVGFRREASQVARLSGAPFIFGGVAHAPNGDPLNSAFVLNANGQISGRYDKMFLVPFGEFVPPGFGWINKVSTEAGTFVPGEKVGVFPLNGHSVGVFICYESAFPHLVRQFADAGSQVLVNLSNDGYFGKSAAREQHLWLVRMRAVENQRWILRSTNNGVTAAVDPAGRIWDRMPDYTREVGRLRFTWLQNKTAYTRFGDWFAWLCLAIGLGLRLLAEFPIYRRT